METAVATRGALSAVPQTNEDSDTTPNGNSFGMPLCPLFYSSKTIKDLTAALSKAQAEMSAAVRDATGQTGGGRKYSYSDLNAVMDVLREPLSRHGLAIMQPQAAAPKGHVRIVTVLSHSSGEWIASTTDMPVGMRVKGGDYIPAYDPHSYGSALTYARRYGLTSMVGVVPQGDDDDAGRAQHGHRQKTDAQQKTSKPPLSWTEADKDTARRIWAYLKTKVAEEKNIPVYLEGLCRFKNIRPVKNLRQLQASELRQFFVKIKPEILLTEKPAESEKEPDAWLSEMNLFKKKIIDKSSQENFLKIIGQAGYKNLEQVPESEQEKVKNILISEIDTLLRTKK